MILQCPKHLHQYSSKILNAIASGMHQDQKNMAIKLEATRALANSLKMVKKNFSEPVWVPTNAKGIFDLIVFLIVSQKERQLIMNMIFSSATSPNEKVRLASFMCLEEVAKSYYVHLGSFMKKIYEVRYSPPLSHTILMEQTPPLAHCTCYQNWKRIGYCKTSNRILEHSIRRGDRNTRWKSWGTANVCSSNFPNIVHFPRPRRKDESLNEKITNSSNWQQNLSQSFC